MGRHLVGRQNELGTAARYIEKILVDHAPYAGFIDDNSIFMHDNASLYTARPVTEYLENVGISVMTGRHDPDLNPIEYLWDQLKQTVRARIPVSLCYLAAVCGRTLLKILFRGLCQ